MPVQAIRKIAVVHTSYLPTDKDDSSSVVSVTRRIVARPVSVIRMIIFGGAVQVIRYTAYQQGQCL